MADREILFGNEAFAIGTLQAVSGAGVVAAVAQSSNLIELAGRFPFLVYLTAMVFAVIAAVLASYFRHQYKLWDVKAQVSQSRGQNPEAGIRGKKANFYLKAMRFMLGASVLLICVGLLELLIAMWIMSYFTLPTISARL